jgi:ubiquinone/menaquinone biosynthesis C-methylase UbiE
MRRALTSVARQTIPAVGIAVALRPGAPTSQRVAGTAAAVGVWSAVYAKYRKAGRAQTARERELLRSASWEAYTRHYNERVPTIEEEFDIWGEYHQHRHEMRYDLVAEKVRQHLPAGGSVLDVGCGSCLVADRLDGSDATYVGLDFPHHHITYAKKRFEDNGTSLRMQFVRGDGEKLPFRSGTFDVVVMSEVIEHLLRPEQAVWEISRVLKPGGVFVMTTNNASEVPLRSPVSHLFAWLEKAFGAYHPKLISLRPWVWPWPVDKDLVAPGARVYLPHTHHIYAETRDMFAVAGMDPVSFSTFEFPPPQAALSAWLDRRGEAGRRAVDVMEAVATRVPLVKRLGCHVLVVSRKSRRPVSARPPAGIWPGPFSETEL